MKWLSWSVVLRDEVARSQPWAPAFRSSVWDTGPTISSFNGDSSFTLCMWSFVVVQLVSRVRLFVSPWTAACQVTLSSTISRNLLNFMSVESVMLTISSSVTTFSFCLQSFPASRSFPRSRLFASGDKSIAVSASTSVLPMNIQGWFSLGLTCLILQSRGLSRVFSNTTV